MKTDFEKILVEQDGRVLHITLNDPSRLNPMSLVVMSEIERAMDEARVDDTIRVVVIKGAGRAFCAGEDVTQGHHWFLDGKAGTFLQGWREKMQKMRLFPKTLIFQIHGWCVGGAVEMALCADFLICAEDAKFMLPQINIGIAAMLEGAILPQAVGIVKAKKMVLTGKPVEGIEAERIGLVSEAVPAEELDGRVRELAAEMAEKIPEVIAAQKDIVHHWMTTDLESSIEHSFLGHLQADDRGIRLLAHAGDRRQARRHHEVARRRGGVRPAAAELPRSTGLDAIHCPRRSGGAIRG